jgi:hypothetical protein
MPVASHASVVRLIIVGIANGFPDPFRLYIDHSQIVRLGLRNISSAIQAAAQMLPMILATLFIVSPSETSRTQLARAALYAGND